MSNRTKEFLLKHGVPCIAILVIAVQLFLSRTQKLNAWKGGGYGMYTSIHYYFNQIHIPGMVVDSLIEDDHNMKETLGRLKLMPTDKNFEKAAKFVLKTTEKDSIHIQVWKPTVNSEAKTYSRALVNEIHFKKSNL